eukprot:762956-Pyramimonas_sp.AAC.1
MAAAHGRPWAAAATRRPTMRTKMRMEKFKGNTYMSLVIRMSLSPRRRPRRRRGRLRRASARISQTAGARAEEKIDMTIIQEISTSGTGGTETRGIILENGGMNGGGDALHKDQYDFVDAGPQFTMKWVHQAGHVGSLRSSAPWQPPLSGKMLLGFARVAVHMHGPGGLGVGATLRAPPRG